MEEIFKQAALQAPALTVLTVLVVLFLRHLATDRAARDVSEKARDVTLKELGDSCHDFQKGMSADIKAEFKKLDSALEKNSGVVAENTFTLRDVSRLAKQGDGEQRRRP